MADRIEQFILRMVEQSTPEKTAWNMEKIREGRPVRWNYIDGCMLTALNVLSDITGNGCYAAFADRVMDHFVREDGSILTLQPEGLLGGSGNGPQPLRLAPGRFAELSRHSAASCGPFGSPWTH